MQASLFPRLTLFSLILLAGTCLIPDATAGAADSTEGAHRIESSAGVVHPRRVVMFNSRMLPGQTEFGPFLVPPHTVLMITDVVVQNRSPGDEPVEASAFSRLVLGHFLLNTVVDGNAEEREQDIFLTVVGNDSLILHFATGMRVPREFRFFTVGNSTAPFVEVTITGELLPLHHRHR